VSYDCQDAECANGVFIQVGKLGCSARICCGRQHEIPQCKKYGAVLLPSPKSTEQDMPLQEDSSFSQIPHTYNLKEAGTETTRVDTDHNVYIRFMMV
jgi:hypothetical protein